MSGNWTYCRRCESGIGEPTVEQALGIEPYCCPVCETTTEPLKSGKDVIIELLQRIQRIEEHLGLGPI